MASTTDNSELRAAVHARVCQSLDKRIEDWRREQPKIPPRSDAIRQLLERGLANPSDAA
jgi:hypothetical protein